MIDALGSELPATGRFERFKNSCGKTWRWLKIDVSNAMAKRIGWYGTGALLLAAVALAIWGIVAMDKAIFAQTEYSYVTHGVKVTGTYTYNQNLAFAATMSTMAGLGTLPFLVLAVGALYKGHKYGNFVLPPQDDNLNNNNL